MELTIFCDGGSRGNPGPAGIGVVIKKDGEVLHEFGKAIGINTNNVAEYTAVIEALAWVGKHEKPRTIKFFLDSQLVVSQLNGVYRIKNENLRMLLMKIREHEGSIPAVITYQHVPREQNKEADRMVNHALNAQQTR